MNRALAGLLIGLAGCSAGQDREERGPPLYDLAVVGSGDCIAKASAIMRALRLRPRNNPGVSEGDARHYIFGPAPLADAAKGRARVAALGCAEQVELVPSRAGDLFPAG